MSQRLRAVLVVGGLWSAMGSWLLAEEPARVGGRITPPRKLKNVAPVYPNEAQRAGIQDVVFADCVIDPAGKVSEVTILRGDPVLAPAVESAVRQWEFSPTLLNGQAIPVVMPALWVGAVTFVAWRCRSLNLFIRLSWVTIGFHSLAAILLLRTLRSVPVGEGGDTVTILIPSDPTLGYAYLGSALVTVGLCLAGSAFSLVRSASYGYIR